MVSSTLQKLLRNQSQSAAKFITHFRNPHPLLTQIPQINKPIYESHFPNNPKSEYIQPNHSNSHVYPTFSFGFFLDPVAPTSLIRPEPDVETTSDDSRTIRADSVKKKRKKKMNKHKLRKLRKRLRRKT